MSDPLETLKAALELAGVTVRPLGPDEPRGFWTRLRPLFDAESVEITGLTRREVPGGAEIAFCEAAGAAVAADWTAEPAAHEDEAPVLRAGGVRFVLHRRAPGSAGPPRPRGTRPREERGHLEGRAEWFRRRHD